MFSKWIGSRKLSQLELSILDYLSAHSDQMHEMSIQKLAQETYTSTTTIFRLAKKLGFEGYTDMIYRLKHSSPIQQEGIQETAELLSEEVKRLFAQNELSLQQLVNLNQKEHYIFILGTGYSGIIAEYLYKKLLGKGYMVVFSNGADTSALFANNIKRISQIICISKSGETDTINKKVVMAKDYRIPVISFTQDNNNRLAKMSDVSFVINDANPYDWDNIETSQFYPLLLMYLEYLVEKAFK